jgi:FkbM family methyltransferase
MLKRLLKNRWSVVSALRLPLLLVARYYKSFHQIRNLVSQLDSKQIDRTTFLKTNAANRLIEEPINYADIGARGGLLDFLKPFEKLLNTIYFEPDFEEFRKIKEGSSSQNEIIINAAVSDRKSTKTLYLTKKRGGSSLLHPSGNMIRMMSIDGEGISRFSVEGTIQIQTQRLDEVVKFEELQIDLLKIDTQGSEFEILSALGAHRPFLICAECATTEIYKGQKSLFTIGALLENLGYFPIRLMDGHLISKTLSSWRNSTQLYGDVIFVPNNSAEGIAIIERDVEKWFASLCMHGYMDFALWQLDELKISKPPLVTETEELLKKSNG